MIRAQALSRLQSDQAELMRLGVRRLYLFGSSARDEAAPTSDMDLFFDYDRGSFGLFELMDVEQRAATILGCKTDIMTRDSLHHALRPALESDALHVF